MAEKGNSNSWVETAAVFLGAASTFLLTMLIVSTLKLFFGFNDLPGNTQLLLFAVIWGWGCFVSKDFWWSVLGLRG